MASLIAGYSCDIFISYRHNDNKSRWVTDFVAHLQEELAATIKEPVSVYFDTNPHDGLLDSHSVDKSLEDKIKCLIFIPVLSQTYCDEKSFAWQHEFIAFRDFAKADKLGADIRLGNGNVASRILPIKIHDLDAEDKGMLEKELGGVLRAIDFSFKGPGVNRPLQIVEQHSNENLNKTNYKDQINKLANAIKELLQGIHKPEKVQPSSKEKPLRFDSVFKPHRRKRIAVTSAIALLALVSAMIFYYTTYSGSAVAERKSIAVLPFKNLSKDPDQEYFTQGITEDILNHLTKIADLRVKASYASFNYKESLKTVSEIGQELNVGSILTGSIQRNGDNVRIIAQLVDVETSEQIWSNNYDRQVDDVLRIQSEIAAEIGRYLKATLTSEESTSIQRPIAQSIDAYEYYLKARRNVLDQWQKMRRADFVSTLELLDKSIDLDPDFSDAFALKGWTWWIGRKFGFSTKTWLDSAMYFAEKSIASDSQNPSGYLLRYQLNRFRPDFDFHEGLSDLDKAYTYSPNNTDVLWAVGQSYLLQGNPIGADLTVKYARLRFTDFDVDYCLFWAWQYELIGDLKKADELLNRAMEMAPQSTSTLETRAHHMASREEHGQAIALSKQVERMLSTRSTEPLDYSPVYTRLSHSYQQIGNLDSAMHYFSKFRDIEKTFPDTTQFIPYRHRLAYGLWVKGDKQGAARLFNEQIKLDSSVLQGRGSIGSWGDLTYTYYDLAVTHAFLGKEDDAMKCFEQLYKRGIEGWMVGALRTDPLIKDLRKKPRFIEFLGRMEDNYQLRVNAIRRAINLHEASEEVRARAK
jgi:TolB-like protein